MVLEDWGRIGPNDTRLVGRTKTTSSNAPLAKATGHSSHIPQSDVGCSATRTR